MLVGRLFIGFDRGIAKNRAKDLGLEEEPTTTEDGKVIRGCGTHYESDDAYAMAKIRSREEQRIRAAFREKFMRAPMPGYFVLPEPGAGQKALDALDPPPREDVSVRVTEYDMTPRSVLPPEEIQEWIETVTKQLSKVKLGRGKETDAAGLVVLERLCECPILAEKTATRIRELIAAARLAKLDRMELKRSLAKVQVEVEVAPVKPGRAIKVDSNEALLDAGIDLQPSRGIKIG